MALADTSASMLAMLDGELARLPHKDSILDLHPSSDSEPDSGAELKVAVTTRIPGRCHSLSELSSKLSDLGLQVRKRLC